MLLVQRVQLVPQVQQAQQPTPELLVLLVYKVQLVHQALLLTLALQVQLARSVPQVQPA